MADPRDIPPFPDFEPDEIAYDDEGNPILDEHTIADNTTSNEGQGYLLPDDDFLGEAVHSTPSTDSENNNNGGIAQAALQQMMQRGTADLSNVDYLQNLNDEQKDAILSIDGPLLVLAGAGTGKTRVLTTRIAHILASQKAYPSQILAVTFTNKAAREMKERIHQMVGDVIEGMPWLGTFHSICVKILRRHAELVGLRSDFTILDTDDQIRLIKQLIQAEGLDEKRWPARQFAAMMDGWKNKGLSPSQIREGDARAFANGRGRELYQAYQERLKVLNAADFGDLLLECIRLFQENSDILQQYHQRFRYILVDEYQDTNVAQYLWLRLLAQNTGNMSEKNICCVGDDDQSIYGWRGAEVDNILRFEKDFPGAKVIRLERNYRSTHHILGAASCLIANNEDRLGKTLYPNKEEADAEPVFVSAAWDSKEEARAVGDEIEQLQRRGSALNEISILVRASFQMREFEERFIEMGLNYRVIGGPRFYERMEIRDAMAYFRVICQPLDDLAFERIVNTPRRGLGDATMRTVREAARARGLSLTATLDDLLETEELKARPRTILKNLIQDFTRWRDALDTMPHKELAEMVLDESGYTEMWQNDKSADAPGRLDNLKELIRSMEEFESLHGFLEHVSLVMDVESSETLDAVNIMTLHSAKGLEFDHVFLPGWEEGLFPHQRALDESGRAGLEEERRLAYVGITRAKQTAHIYFASNRRIHGLWQSSQPSRFLEELPRDHIELRENSSNYGGYGAAQRSRFDTSDPFNDTSRSSPGWRRAQQKTNNSWSNNNGGGNNARTINGQVTARRVTPVQSTKSKPSQFKLHERVMHVKFGFGEITDIDGNKLTIDFDNAGQKRVLDSFIEKITE
jgi:DNA helicase-2/ATP-dependent DNA helicase PcrA